MEFDFILAQGKVQVKLEAGFELLATWVEQELLSTPQRIRECKAIIHALESGLISSWQLNTSEHVLDIDADELLLNSHSAQLNNEQSTNRYSSIFEQYDGFENELESDFDGYASELEQAGCGTRDFYKMLSALEDFCQQECCFNQFKI